MRLAQKFEALVLADPRFEIPAARHLGMVVIRLKGDNVLTERLLKRLNSRGNIHCVPASLKGNQRHLNRVFILYGTKFKGVVNQLSTGRQKSSKSTEKKITLQQETKQTNDCSVLNLFPIFTAISVA